MRILINIAFLFTFFLQLSCQKNVATLQRVDSYQTSVSKLSDQPYPSLDEIYFSLNQFKKHFPNRVTLYTLGKSARYHHSIPLIRIQNSPTVKYKILLIGGIHGDEAIGVRATLFITGKLLEMMDKKGFELSAFRFDIIPVLNTDGYNDNIRENGNGININRNFPFGQEISNPEVETRAIMNLINNDQYHLSLFFHSANEGKYENVIRFPVEYQKKGLTAFKKKWKVQFRQFLSRLINSLNVKNIPHEWSIHSDYVDVAGIGSDWIMAPFIKTDSLRIKFASNSHPHLSMNIELCYPKQPMDPLRIASEEQEAYRLILSIIQIRKVIPSYE